MAQGATFCLRCGAKVNDELNFVKENNNMSNKPNNYLNSLKSKPLKKNNIITVLIVLLVIIILFSVLNGGDSTKRKMIGTWYLASNPENCIELFKNNTGIFRTKSSNDGFSYRYNDGVITFNPETAWLGYADTYYIEIKGDTMYLTIDGTTDELYKSQKKAEKAYEKLSEQWDEY